MPVRKYLTEIHPPPKVMPTRKDLIEIHPRLISIIAGKYMIPHKYRSPTKQGIYEKE